MLELMAGDDGGDGGDVLAGALDSPDARAVEVGLHGLAPRGAAQLNVRLELVLVPGLDGLGNDVDNRGICHGPWLPLVASPGTPAD